MKKRAKTAPKKCISYSCAACGGGTFDNVAFAMKEEAERLTNPPGWLVCYFTDPDRPAGKRFLGACLVWAHGVLTAVTEAHRLGINPGGAVLCDDAPAGHDPTLRNRLITDDAEMEQLGFKRRTAS